MGRSYPGSGIGCLKTSKSSLLRAFLLLVTALMLIHMDPALLAKPEWNSLKNFLRWPFSEESCQRVDEDLPQLAQAYRAMAGTRSEWEGALPISQVEDAPCVFMRPKAIGPRQLPWMPDEMLKTQVILFEEVVRDNAAWVRKRAEKRARTENGSASGCVPMPKLNVDISRLALRAIALHEATFFVLAGLFEVRTIGSQIEFSLTPRGLESLRNRVLTTPMQEQTELMLRQKLLSIIANLRRCDRTATSSIAALVGPTLLDDLADRFLDTFFSLGDYMRRDAQAVPLIRNARGLCRWFALLELVRLAGEIVLHPASDLIESLRLDSCLLEQVLAERTNALPSDRGIQRSVSGALSLGTSGLAHAIHCCKGAVLSETQARELGKKFEDQIASYVRTAVPATDYLVRRGFKRSDNGAGLMYDCDLTLYDVARRKIFFIQAKWKRDSRTAGLDDELHDWGAKNGPLTKGIDRLAALRARLAERAVLDQVHAALGDIKLPADHILANSHFIVLHTLPYFNAYQIDGVVVYEWNLFRNLLSRGALKRRWSPTGSPEHSCPLPLHLHDTVLALENPQQVLDYYCAASGMNLSKLPAAIQLRQEARYGFDLTLPNASWWQRLTKRDSVNIFLPYI